MVVGSAGAGVTTINDRGLTTGGRSAQIGQEALWSIPSKADRSGFNGLPQFISKT